MRIFVKTCLLFSVIYIIYAFNMVSATESITPSNGYFEGIITVEQTSSYTGPLSKSTVEYIFTENKFKRSIKLRGINTIVSIEAGLIIDMVKDSIVFYQKNTFDKYYCKLSIKDYRTEIADRINNVGRAGEVKPYETMYLPFKNNSPYLSKISPQEEEIKNLSYQLIDIKQDISHWKIKDSPDIKTKKEFIELTFPDLPKEVTGFPISCTYEILSDSKDSFQEVVDTDSLKYSKQLFGILDKVTQVLSHIKQKITKVSGRKVDEHVFNLHEGFKRVKSLEELSAKFPEGSYGD